MTRAVERLAEQFAHLPLTTVVRVVTDCTARDPDPDVARIEHDASKDLATLRDPADQEPDRDGR